MGGSGQVWAKLGMVQEEPARHDFNPKKEQDVLRRWLRLLAAREGVSADDIRKEVLRRRPKCGLSRTTLDRFVETDRDQNLHERTQQRLKYVWDYLWSRPDYRARLSEIIDLRESTYEPAEDAVFRSLTRFLSDGPRFRHKLSLDRMRQMLPGRYVLYRPSTEHLVGPRTEKNLIRASLLEISVADECIHVTELQEFEPRHGYPALRQKNYGVMVPHGKYALGIMRAAEVVSVKVLVIDRFEPYIADMKLDWLYGKLFVASELALFPSVPCICKRIKGQPRPQHGLYKPEEIDSVVVKYLTTPTFPEGNVIP